MSPTETRKSLLLSLKVENSCLLLHWVEDTFQGFQQCYGPQITLGILVFLNCYFLFVLSSIENTSWVQEIIITQSWDLCVNLGFGPSQEIIMAKNIPLTSYFSHPATDMLPS